MIPIYLYPTDKIALKIKDHEVFTCNFNFT